MDSPSIVCPRRSDALVSPSVTYGPNRPSLMTSGFSVSGSTPISRSGGAGGPALPGLRRGQQGQRLVQGDREDLVLVGQRAGVVAALDVRAVAAGAGEDLDARPGPCRPAGAASAACSASARVSVSGDCDCSSDALRLAGGHVRPVPAGLQHDRLAGLRVLAELALAAAAEEQLVDLLRGQLVRARCPRAATPGRRVPLPSSVALRRRACRRRRARCAAGTARTGRPGRRRRGRRRRVNSGIELTPARVDLAEVLGDHASSARRRRAIGLHAAPLSLPK